MASKSGRGICVGEEDHEEADQGQDLAQGAQCPGDHQVRDGQQPLHERPPPGDVAVGVELELEGIGGGRGHDDSLD